MPVATSIPKIQRIPSAAEEAVLTLATRGGQRWMKASWIVPELQWISILLKLLFPDPGFHHLQKIAWVICSNFYSKGIL